MAKMSACLRNAFKSNKTLDGADGLWYTPNWRCTLPKKITQFLQTLLKRLMARLKSPLPQTDAELQTWLNDVLELAQMPKNDSFVNALCTMLMHSTKPTAAKADFVDALKVSVLKQAAYNQIDTIRRADNEARRAAEAKGVGPFQDEGV